MIDSLGHVLVSWLLAVNAWTAVLLAFAVVADRALARRARASVRIALYAPVALRVLLPLSWSISVVHATRVATLLTPLAVVPASVATPAGLAPAPVVTWHAALLVVYVAIAALLGVRAVLRRVRLSRALDTARSVSSIDLPHPVVSHPVLGPMVAGLLSPRIVVPEALLAGDSRPALMLVLRHEVAHLQRRDPWLSAGLQVLLVGAWPVLPLWLAAGRVRHLVELACDEDALAGADAAQRRRYGHALLEIAEQGSFAAAGAGELSFGSMLRSRIEALATQKHLPRRLQAALVGLVVIGLAACSSVGPSPTQRSPASRAEPEAAPTRATITMTEEDLRHRCPDFIQRFTGWSDPAIRWMSGPVDGIPADEVTYCRGADVASFAGDLLWVGEVHNVVGQMASDLAAAFEHSSTQGSRALCPSDGPVPRQLQPPGEAYQPTSDDWKGPGFACMEFAMDQPMHFQYALHTDARGFVITAHAQRPKGDHHVDDLTVVLRGVIRDGAILEVAPKVEEHWTEVQ